MRYLIMGSGEIARHLTDSINLKGSRAIVLNDNIHEQNHSSYNANVIHAVYTGCLMEDLQRAKIATVDGFLACSEDDNRNAMAAQIATQIFQVPLVLCHIGNELKYTAYKEIGLAVVSFTLMVSDTLFSNLENF
jgi:trk system potassium uptake protein TrkA